MYRENKGKTGVKGYLNEKSQKTGYIGFCWHGDIKRPSEYNTHADCIGSYRADANHYRGYAFYIFDVDGYQGGAIYPCHNNAANTLFMDAHVAPVEARRWPLDFRQEYVTPGLVEYQGDTGAIRTTYERSPQ